jgi:hypothetical protein
VRLTFWYSYAVCGIIAALDIFINAASIYNGNSLHLTAGEFALLAIRLLLFGLSPFVRGKLGIAMLLVYAGIYLDFLLTGTNA